MTEDIKGYIYITGTGADPAARQNLNDPLFTKTASLAACMPNIRRFVSRGDYIFVVSGSVPGVQQYVIGGMRVAEKLSALAAYRRFPENRLRQDADGKLVGNIPIDSRGNQHHLDHHDPASFANRVKNFIVGDQVMHMKSPMEVELSRAQTLTKLSLIMHRRANRVIDVMGRWSKLDAGQIAETIEWLKGIKETAARRP
jgi:hypothetical protein